MRVSDNGLDIIKRFEGFSPTPYICPAGVWTIGYGTTVYAGLPVGLDTPRVTEIKASEMLREDVARFEAAVNDAVDVSLTQNQFDALVSLAYNIGAAAFQRSTLLRRLNEGDYAGAAAQFRRWNKANGRTLPGLTKRRADEAKLFLKE